MEAVLREGWSKVYRGWKRGRMEWRRVAEGMDKRNKISFRRR